MISKEEAELVKKQLIEQIETTFPADKKELAKKQLLEMNEKQLEEFLNQNNLMQPGATTPKKTTEGPPQCIFCSIIEEKVPSYKIDENKDSIAVLELNPISKGHSLILPKEHLESSEKLPQSAFALAKKIAKKLKLKLKPKEIQITSASVFGHELINILPIYKEENMGSQRIPADKADLEKLKKTLEKKKAPKKATQKREKIKDPNILVPRRIP